MTTAADRAAWRRAARYRAIPDLHRRIAVRAELEPGGDERDVGAGERPSGSRPGRRRLDTAA